MKEARFPESWGLYCRLPEPQLAWEIYGDFHIWRQRWRRIVPAYLSGTGVDGRIVLLTTDIAIGRKTGKSAIYAYESMKKNGNFLE